MYYYLTEINEEKREIHLKAEDKSHDVVIDAADAAWTGIQTDVEVVNVPNGATVYYTDDTGERTYKNYLFSPEGAKEV